MKIEKFDRTKFIFECPGCGENHWFESPRWQFNGDWLKPTVMPSILSRDGETICHFFIRSGRIEFCADSTHELAGKTVEMLDV